MPFRPFRPAGAGGTASRAPVALVALVAAGLLAACAQPSTILKANEAGISIALESGVDSLAEAVEAANQHCVNVRRIAVLDQVQSLGGRRIAFFDCVAVS